MGDPMMRTSMGRSFLFLLFFICGSFLVYLVIDKFHLARQMGTVRSCQANMRVLSEAIRMYREKMRSFPSGIVQLEEQGIFHQGSASKILDCYPSWPHPSPTSFRRPFLPPKGGNEKAIVSWCPHYHEISHIGGGSQGLRVILRADGTMETVTEEVFKELNREFKLQDEDIPRPDLPSNAQNMD